MTAFTWRSVSWSEQRNRRLIGGLRYPMRGGVAHILDIASDAGRAAPWSRPLAGQRVRDPCSGVGRPLGGILDRRPSR